MSTRSLIGRRHGDEIVGIYCHYDGYPSHVGKILTTFHNSADHCSKLLEGAHIRNFNHDGTVARFGKGDGESETYISIEDALGSGFDYVYLYGDEGWKCYGHDVAPYSLVCEFAIPR